MNSDKFRYWIHALDVDHKETTERYFSAMRKDDDAIFYILKGHLLIEQSLDNVIRSALPNPESFSSMRLSCAGKISLARALCWEHSDSVVWDMIISVNKLRNHLAHKLDSAKRDSLISVAFSHLYRFTRESGGDEVALRQESETMKLLLLPVGPLGFLTRFAQSADSLRGATRLLWYGVDTATYSTTRQE